MARTVPAPEPRPTTGRVGVVLLALVVPAAAISLIAGPVAGAAFPVGLFAGLAIMGSSGRTTGAPFMALAPGVAMAAAYTATTTWWAPLFAVLGACIALQRTEARALPMLQVALVASIVPPLANVRELAIVGAFVAVGELLGAAVATKVPWNPARTAKQFRRRPLPIGLVIDAALLGGAAYWAVHLGGEQAHWWVTAPLVLWQVIVAHRRAGDQLEPDHLIVAGFAVAAMVAASVFVPDELKVAVGAALLAIGLLQRPGMRWVSFTAIAGAAALAADPTGDLLALGSRRLVVTAVALAVVLVIAVAVRFGRMRLLAAEPEHVPTGPDAFILVQVADEPEESGESDDAAPKPGPAALRLPSTDTPAGAAPAAPPAAPAPKPAHGLPGLRLPDAVPPVASAPEPSVTKAPDAQ